MTFEEILKHRRAVRKYAADKPIDASAVEKCIRLATLAPTSSNMQLWECYHVVDKSTLRSMAEACLGQQAAATAQQMVVFVTRQDRWREHCHEVLAQTEDDIRQTSPAERVGPRIELQRKYYCQLMPLMYKRCFGLLGMMRKALVSLVGLRRAMPREVTEGDIRTVVHKSCALVAMTFMLAMNDRGYDTCPMEGFDSRRVKRCLGLPRDCEVSMVISCGIRAEGGVHGNRQRLPFEEFYHKI